MININTAVIDSYIEQLMTASTAEIPVWNIEKARAGKKSGWDYIDGCMILSLLEFYDTTKNEKYLKFADYYEDFRVHDDGSIDGYNKDAWNVDEVNGAKNLITLYTLTGKEKYKKAAANIYDQVVNQPRTKEGNFWHKKIYPNQIWLDGLYMVQPFYMEYEAKYNDSRNVSDIYKQFFNVYELMRDKETGLYYHAYDSSKMSFWCNKESGLSQNFWLRSLGWYAMALLDTLNKASDKTSDDWKKLKSIFVDFMRSMTVFQSENGMWYQIPNMTDKESIEKGNYLETSGSAIMAYAMMKGARMALLPKEYAAIGKKAFEGICEKYLKVEDKKMHLGGICLVAGLGPENNRRRDGTFEYYMSEPIVSDDAKGVGPFILAYNEYKLLH